MEQEILDYIALLQDEIKKIYNVEVKIAKVLFNMNGRSAGSCRIPNEKTGAIIRLNRVLLEENGYNFIHNTVTHEFAHAADWYINKTWGHGTGWATIMNKLGAPPEIYHSYNLDNVKIRKVRKGFIYACDCREHNLTIIRHNKIQKKGVNYRCNQCGGTLNFIREEK